MSNTYSTTRSRKTTQLELMTKGWESATWLPGYEAAWHASRTYSMARQVSMRHSVERTVMPLYTNSIMQVFPLNPTAVFAKKIKLSQGLL